MEREFDISCGVDVGKWSHHFTAIDRRTGEILLDEKIGQDEGEIRSILSRVLEFWKAVVVVDQLGNMSALLFAVADDMGILRGFIMPKAMAQAIEMYGGEVKTDAHDAFVIAEVSASLPRLVKPVSDKSDACLRLATLMSYDREFTEEATRTTSRLRDLLLSACSAFEAHLSNKRIQRQFYLTVLARYRGRLGLKRAGRGNVRRWVKSRKGMGSAALAKIDELFDVISRQTVSLLGTEGIEELIRLEATYLLMTH